MFCARCSTDKPALDFYAGDKTCKVCRCSIVRANRAAKSEHYKAFDAARANRPDRVAAREAYRKTDAGKAAVARAHKKYHESKPERRSARVVLGNAVKSGLVTPWPVCAVPECEDKPEAHHPDYSAPLAVVWLCCQHHREIHLASDDDHYHKHSS